MRYTFLFILLIYSATTFAQSGVPDNKTKARYEAAFTRFIKYYNASQSDSLNLMMDTQWGKNEISDMHDQLGVVKSWKYIGPFKSETDTKGNLMCYFKLVFDKPTKMRPIGGFDRSGVDGKKIHAASIALTNENKIFGMRFITSSPAIDSLIARY